MELLKMGQLYKSTDLSKQEKLELASKIEISYCIPNDIYRNIQEKSFVGYNCLHLAALKLDIDFIDELLQRGADPLKQGTKDNKTPVHVAVNVKTNGKGKHIWEMSGKLRDCQVVNALLLAHVKSNNPSNPKCKHGLSHLHIACMFNCVEAVQFFLKNGEPINQVTNVNAPWPSYTPLHFAMRYSSAEVAEILLTNGANLFAKDIESISPLQILINRLLDVVDYVTIGERAICIPYEEELKRLETIVKTVIKLKSENAKNILDETGLTIFHLACTLRNTSIAASFMYDNLDLNMPVKKESKFWPAWTPLHFAACSTAETVKLLVQKGADITVKNAIGETPLDMCLKRYDPQVVHSILSIKDEFKNILISNSSDTLLELLWAMKDTNSFQKYLETLNDIDISVSPMSPILPGYNLLHLALSMNARAKPWINFLQETDLPENLDSFLPVYNCTEFESHLYFKRILACLEKGCSVDSKNCNGLTPIHLAFKTDFIKSGIFEELFNYTNENVLNPDNFSHLHIACAVGNQLGVHKLYFAQANINTATEKSFQWYKKSDESSVVKNRSLISVNANSTPLHIAVTFGYIEIIEILLDYQADIYATDSEEFTPIHLSITHSSNQIAKTILSRPQELIELVTKEGLTHMHVAAFAGNVTAITMLICNGANINSRINDAVPSFLSRFAGKTPLQLATQHLSDIDLPAIKTLIEYDADIYANDTLQCLMDETDVPYSEYLIDELRLNNNVNGPIDSSGLTLLHIACSKFYLKWATELINKGADVNARIRSDENYKGKWKGYTPLHALISRKYHINDSSDEAAAGELGRLLLERSADTAIDSQNGTPLHLAFRGYQRKEKSKESASILPNDLPDMAPRVMLPRLMALIQPGHVAQHLQRQLRQPQLDPSAEFQIPVLRQPQRDLPFIQIQQQMFLIQPGGLMNPRGKLRDDNLIMLMLQQQISHEVNPISPDGFSHFHFYCMANMMSIVRQYLDIGVDINHSTDPFSENCAGYTALHFAIKNGCSQVINLLIDSGASVDVESADGNTPLHLMIALTDFRMDPRGDLLTLQRLGANFNAKNMQGETPADVLMTKRFFNLQRLQFLLSKGSSINPKKNSSLPGPIALIIQNASANERMQIFKLFLDVCDVRAAMRDGYNPIQDIAKAKNDNPINKLTVDDYIRLIIEFLKLDCNVDQLDEKGFTPLHNAIILGNTEAFYALIQLGADINSCNLDDQILAGDIREHLAYQVHKMHILQLNVSDANNSIYRQFRKDVSMKGPTEMFIDLELEQAERVKLTGNLTVRAFLSDLWGTVYYSKLPPTQREIIDQFFKNTVSLLKQFPLLCGIMLSQYNKAIVRSKLVEPARDLLAEILSFECEIHLPELCLDCILNYVINDDLKYLLENSDGRNRSKRLRIE